jgi:inorganic triphosphatase YgiF
MAQPEEIELKLEVPSDEIVRLGRLSLLRGVKPDKSKTLVSVYFDTAKQKLRRNGLSLRVRRANGNYVQTIKKRGGRSVGLFERNEWECNLADDRPDLDAARDTPLVPLLNKKLRRTLKPLFETHVRRQSYPVRKHGSEIELTVDKGKVEAAGRSSPLCEIELELKKGDPADLFELAGTIGKLVPVALASKSKAGRGYDLIAKDDPGPVKGDPIALAPDVTWATAFRIIARACLYQIAANERFVRQGDAEGVHQMRIGIRRLRTAISLFKDMLAGGQTEAIKSELKWLTDELGPARELDVFVKRAVTKDSDASGPGLCAVAEDFRKRRGQAFEAAAKAVTSLRFRQLILDAAEWIAIGEWSRNNDELHRSIRERPVADAAAEELSRRQKKIHRQGRHLAELDPQRFHKLRIRAKKLRYAAEFFAGAFSSKKAARRRDKFAAKLKAMQDALGDINDIRVHEGLAKQTMASHAGARERRDRRARRAFAAGRLSGREGARSAPVMKEAERAYSAFAKVASFWS